MEPPVTTRRRVRGRLRLAVAALATVALLAGGWLWLRDSSLVAVRHVSITGVTGPDAGRIRSVLTVAARNMTTLNVRVGQLRTAVAPYAVVKDVRVSTQFPHGLRIRVLEQLPVGALVAGGRAVAAAGDGILLHDVAAASLPTIPVSSLPGGSQVTDRTALDALALLADTPPRLAGRISQVTEDASHGLVVQLRSGPSIYFGADSELDAKWTAATEVLADPGSAGASYIDVTDPARPAAGAGPAAVAAAGLATAGSAGSGSQSGPSTSAATSGVRTPQPTSTIASSGG
jgi:cell division protein FtsQ